MKSLILATTIAAVIAGPALAAPAVKTTHHHVRHERSLNDSNAWMAIDPIGVYVDGREIGRDPDPAIRSELLREYYTEQGE